MLPTLFFQSVRLLTMSEEDILELKEHFKQLCYRPNSVPVFLLDILLLILSL